jgi:hypothetical protein
MLLWQNFVVRTTEEADTLECRMITISEVMTLILIINTTGISVCENLMYFWFFTYKLLQT